ncbi:MAG TPA: 50S ribosomal protein L19e [Candidatus Acidoferrales bacterium]|nr:50S ribosomal protein L19e [Candidatus Acidoferrales bacterium]
MSIKLTRRIAAQVLKRGQGSVRLKADALAEAKKAITREDVRVLVKGGGVYAVPKKHNLSLYSKELNEKRTQGRKRGPGKRKGSRKARGGVDYKKKIRAQRRVLAQLKQENAFDNETFKSLYRLVKGGDFQSKISLLSHIKSRGINITDEQLEKLRHI